MNKSVIFLSRWCENDESQWIEHIEDLTQPHGRHPENHEMIDAQMAKEIKEIYFGEKCQHLLQKCRHLKSVDKDLKLENEVSTPEIESV